MKINCPICHRKIELSKKDENLKVYECFNQCLRLTKLNDDNETLRGYVLRVNMDGKEYLFRSSQVDFKNNENKISCLLVFNQGYKTVAILEQFFPIEEVFPDPKRIVKRLLNLRAFT